MHESPHVHGIPLRWAVLVAAAALAPSSNAMEIDSGNPDLKFRWDNTVKYTLVSRLSNPDAALTSDPNLDDGDRNFKKGLVSNRFDLLSEADLAYKNIGARASAAAWYDAKYNQSNANTSNATVNSTGVPAGQFTPETRNVMGRKSEVLDAFAYYKSEASSETPFIVRAGRHTVLYGETLFFGANGIAGAQSPVDIIKALSVPGSQFKEIIRPVGQVSGQIQLTPQLSIGAYGQYQWEKTRIPASGSFLSDADFVGPGARSFLAGGPVFAVTETHARNTGQGGIQVKFQPGSGGLDLGLYAVRYNDKSPQLYVRPVTGTLNLAYAEGINAYGTSFSTVLFGANIAGEASIRTNAALNSDPQLDLAGTGNGRGNALYAVGKTGHINLSVIQLMDKFALWDSASVLAELAWNRTLSISKNAAALDPNTTRDATAVRLLFTPQYYQVTSGVDLSVPIVLGYNLSGRSSAVGKFNGGVYHGGDLGIGLTADYQKRLTVGLNYVRFLGSRGPFLTATNPQALSFKQSLADRNFVSLSVQYAF